MRNPVLIVGVVCLLLVGCARYEYQLVRSTAVPDNNPLSPKFQLFIKIWQRMPLQWNGDPMRWIVAGVSLVLYVAFCAALVHPMLGNDTAHRRHQSRFMTSRHDFHTAVLFVARV